jgi:pectinesterase
MRYPVLPLLAAACLGAASAHAAPAIKPDLTVAADGSGDFTTVEAAVASIPKANHERKIIFIKNGVYHEKVRIDASDVTLLGQSRARTRIEFAQSIVEARTARDGLGQGVVNVNGDDCVLQNLTIQNTHDVIGIHAFAVYGRGDRTVITDANIWSQGNDTLSLWRTSDGMFSEDASAHTSPNGRYYHARIDVCGSVDFICPRGTCYLVDSNIHEVKAQTEAVWHDGNRDKDMKFVLRDCHFDGPQDWRLARHHHDGQFYFIDCLFSATMLDRPPQRVIYPLNGGTPTAADIKNNKEHDPTNIWGERSYFSNTHRDGGDYAWMKENLESAVGSPKPEQVTAAWTFGGKWDPENRMGPVAGKVEARAGQIAVIFPESVTVKGRPRLVLQAGGYADYASGSGSTTLLFTAPAGAGGADKLDFDGGAIIATEAAATLRVASTELPAS